MTDSTNFNFDAVAMFAEYIRQSRVCSLPSDAERYDTLIKLFLMKSNPENWLLFCACFAVLATGIACGGTVATLAGQHDLALNKPAYASSIENDDQSAGKANDGDDDTHWCADDEPENGAEWWQVDLQKRADLSGCQITFPYDGKQYRYKVEGSADRKTWTLLSDQSQCTSRTQVRNLSFRDATGIRYVKITILGFDEGCWASIAEVKVFGK